MTTPLRVLLLEDRPTDARLIVHELRRAGYAPEWQRVDTEADYLAHLDPALDVILADYGLPRFDVIRALELVRERELDIPFIVVSGSIGEERAVACLQQGATDYLLKDRLSRLGSAVARALDARRARAEQAEAATAIQQKNEELQTMSQQLWQAAKLATLGELAASIAHELNNPLATVSLRVEALLEALASDDPKRRPLEIVEQEVARMSTLVANLLEFSRRSHAQISTLDVREEIDNALELMYYHLRNRRIAVVREFATDVPLLHADRQQLRQVLLNLLTNASDAMPEGGTVTIRVATAPSEGVEPSPGQQVVLEVADTGHGIAPEDLPKVMTPFFTTKPAGKGTGLGLAICRRIVAEYGGSLDLRSSPGEGTTIRLGLPIADGRNSSTLRDSAS